MKKTEMVIMVGIPGCGKSTFQKYFLPYHERVNLDSIHALLAPATGFNRKNMALARTIEEAIIKDRLSKGISIVIDNTNISKKIREKYFRLAEDFDVKITAVTFMPDIETAKKQNKQRERKVPEIAIAGMAKNFEAPSYEEGFELLVDAAKPTGLIGSMPAIFLDRDGVITVNRLNGKKHYLNKIEDIIYLENSIKGLKKISEKGYSLYIISNQGGVGLGTMDESALKLINKKIVCDLAENGVDIKEVFCCVHKPNSGCLCRKPETGMIIQASREHDLDPTLSYMIGDMTSDIELGRRVGAETILVKTGLAGEDKKFPTAPTHIASDLVQASELIKKIN